MTPYYCDLYFTILCLSSRESSYNAGATGDMGLIPGSGRFPWGREWQPTSVSCQKYPMDRGAWWATGHGVTKSWT